MRGAILTVLLLLAPPLLAQTPSSGEVTLPLDRYLALRDQARAAEGSAGGLTTALVTSRRIEVVVDGAAARVHSRFEVVVEGRPGTPVPLPSPGVVERVELDPAESGAFHRAEDGSLEIVPRISGLFRVEVEGILRLPAAGGLRKLRLPATRAPISEVTLDLPAELAWTCPGVPATEGTPRPGRQRVRLAPPPGRELSVELGRRLAQGDGRPALVQAVVVTAFDVEAGAAHRHDIVLYEVLRGEVNGFELALPPGLVAERLGTDEGALPPPPGGARLTVARSRRLTGTGYVAVSSEAGPGDALSLAAVEPTVPVRARYLVVAAGVAVEAEPRPESAWSRVDLADLPAPIRGDLAALHPTAAWRRVEAAADHGHLALRRLPAAPATPGLVLERETTTLLTGEGTLVHQERLRVRGVRGRLEIALPPGSSLWSASVDGTEVRPVARGGGLTLPLAFRNGAESRVEVVAVEKKALPPGRSRLALSLARVGLPVVAHRWRLLLPERNRYRLAASTLRLVSQGVLPSRGYLASTDAIASGATTVEEMIEVRAESAEASPRESREIAELERRKAILADEIGRLGQGLVGGVKPLPVQVPESGKLLLLAGALPPPEVSAEIEVRGR